MRKQLFIQLPEAMASGAEDGAQSVRWVVRDDERPGGSLFQGSLAEAAQQAAGARVVALAPGADVLLAAVELPNLNRQRLARAVPFALEEQFADDVEALHFALGRRGDDGRVNNAVVARDDIESWLDRLKAAGLQVDVMSSEVLGVPLTEAAEGTVHWALLVDGERCLLRTGEQRGLAVETENLPRVLHAALEESGVTLPSQLDVTVCGDSTFTHSESYRQLCQLGDEQGIGIALHTADEDADVLLARGFNEQNAINLLQGGYSRREQLEKLLRPWWPALALLGLWLVVQITLMGLDYRRLAEENEAMRGRIVALYQEAFPEARKVVNPKVQMQRGLDKLRAGSGGQAGFLGLLEQAGPVLHAVEGVNLRSLRYKEGKLDIDLEIGDLQTLDRLKQRLLDEAGLQVEIVSASSREGKVESRIALRRGGA